MILIDGKKVSASIQEKIAAEVKELANAGERPPHLVAVLVGDDPASQTYVRNKINACKKVGFKSTLIHLEPYTSEAKLLQVIAGLNADSEVDGYIVQLPLPSHISQQKVIEAIHPSKDVDGFHPMNVGRMVLNLPAYVSATPYGIMQLLEHYRIETSGKHCVVVGRSHIVGSPMSILMARNTPIGNATVTLCHSKTQNLKEITLTADILIAAIGRPWFITADMVKPGAVVIDVGINRVDDNTSPGGYKLMGDVDFENVKARCSYITPVPGGVGPMTIASLLKNTLLARKKIIY
ncbi:MAG: bifunctional methylenetetrahydrofolate dehydrogenase/methenyltetrahydrofolate cyclohydrolase FolD [Bacteroidia bacterium]|nr:bifunctional methylenetetrahydrofolate dehydrogenase/methenyltetrahydrofolate cyclohydrolase FolD [Bacteroidia bacterium]